MPSPGAVLDAWRAAPLAEIAWLTSDGRPEIGVVVPLIDDGRPATALTYDRLAEGRRLAAAQQVCLVVAEQEGGHRLLADARVRIVEDATGEVFSRQLLVQELAKHPPSRALADSMLLRSEHWWYLPRVLVGARVGEVLSQPGRDALAVVATASGLSVTSVTLAGSSRSPRLDPRPPDGPVTVLQHGVDLPRMEQPWHRRWWGTMEAGRLVLDGWDEHRVGARPPGLMRRWRDEAALARACRQGLREAGLL